MRLLIDSSAANIERLIGKFPDLPFGQLLTPLTRYSRAAVPFAIDNGAFSGFDNRAFDSLLERESSATAECMFVCCPDVVGDAQRTLELFTRVRRFIPIPWKVALVSQDGMENHTVPWDDLDCLFVGGMDPWKDSAASKALVRTAKILGKHVHVGRVNSARRYMMFKELGADTCDGTGISRFDHMIEDIAWAVANKGHACLWD